MALCFTTKLSGENKHVFQSSQQSTLSQQKIHLIIKISIVQTDTVWFIFKGVLKLQYLSVCLSVCPSVSPHRTRLPLDGFSGNLIFEYFSKIRRKVSSSNKIWLLLFLFMTSVDETHSGFRNVVGKLTSHTVQKPQNQKVKSDKNKAHLKTYVHS